MAGHKIKSVGEIEEEIRRRAQGAANAEGEDFTIHTPSIVSTPEATTHGSHWIIMTIREPGVGYVETAAVQLAKIWDVGPG